MPYASKSAAAAWKTALRIGVPPKACAHCGTEFYRLKTMSEGRWQAKRFCSEACRRQGASCPR